MNNLKKNILFFIFIFGFKILFSQVTIATDEFDIPGNWNLNVVTGAPVSSVIPAANIDANSGNPTFDNRWIINDVYSNSSYNCYGVIYSADNFTVRPDGNPTNNNYLHLSSECAQASSNFSASWNPRLLNKRRFFASMNYDFNTVGYFDVNFSYWVNQGQGIAIYYSVNQGVTWIKSEDVPLNGSWSNRASVNPDFDNQVHLRFGFLWDDSRGAQYPYPGIDAINIFVPELISDFSENKTVICATVKDTIAFTGLSSPENTGISYEWNVYPDLEGIDWVFVNSTDKNSKNVYIKFLTTGENYKFKVSLSTSRNSTSQIVTKEHEITVINYDECVCKGGGGTVTVLEEEPLLTNWILSSSPGTGNWVHSVPDGYENAPDPGSPVAFLDLTFSDVTGTYADIDYATNIDCTEPGVYELSFDLYNQTEMFNVINTLEVYISTDGGITWGSPVYTNRTDTGPYWERIPPINLGNLNSDKVRIRFRGIRSALRTNSFTIIAWCTGIDNIFLKKKSNLAAIKYPQSQTAVTEGNNPMCKGDLINFSCTPSNVGKATVGSYIWKKNGNVVQSGLGNTFSTKDLSDLDTITCVIQMTGWCTESYGSSPYIAKVDSWKEPTIKIIAEKNTGLCKGESVLYKSIAENPGEIPEYVWTIKNKGVVGNTDSLKIDSLSNKDILSLSLKSSIHCPLINPVFDEIPIIIFDSTKVYLKDTLYNICLGDTLTFKPVISGQKPFVFEWYNDSLLINSETDSIISITNQGNYKIKVSGICGEKYSGIASVYKEYIETSIFPEGMELCEGDSAFIKIQGSQKGVIYNIISENRIILNQKGTGEEINFNIPDTLLSTGKNIFETTVTGEFCKVELSQTEIIKNLNPKQISLTADNFCADSDLNLSITESQNGKQYLMYIDDLLILDTVANDSAFSVVKNSKNLDIGFHSIEISAQDTATGCKTGSYYKDLFEIYPMPERGFMQPDFDICADDYFTIEIDNYHYGSKYSLFENGFDTGLEIEGIEAKFLHLKGLKSGIYTIQVTNEYGCKDFFIDSTEVEILPCEFFIPEAFSPNGDGANDFFFVIGLHRFPGSHIIIVNRWGNKVFESNDYQNDWNGTSDYGLNLGGNDLPVGVYYYILDIHNGYKPFTGSIFLGR